MVILSMDTPSFLILKMNKERTLLEAKRVILSLTAGDIQNEKIIENVIDLKLAIEDLIRIYRFPRASNKYRGIKE